jgi:hypothetical protein
MAADGNSAQQWITAVDEIRSGGEIVDNLARMSEAPVLLPGGTCGLVAGNTGRRGIGLAAHIGRGWWL